MADSQHNRFQPGDQVKARYVIEALLADRKTGEVYRARHNKLGHGVAVTIHARAASEQDRARLERSAYLLAQIRHDNVVAMLDYWLSDAGEPVLITELVAGLSLRRLLEQQGPQEWTRVVDIGVGIVRGLQAVHDAHILHRNLTPDTVYLEPGPPEFAKLTDLGLAKSAGGDTHKKITQFGKVVGDLRYAAPELAFGDPASESADLYAAGLVMYELLTGSIPRSSERRMAAPPRPKGLDDRFGDLLDKLMAPLPKARYGDASEVRRELEAIQTRAMKKAVRSALAAIDFDAIDRLRVDPKTVVGPRAGGDCSSPLRGLVAVAVDATQHAARDWLSDQLQSAELAFGLKDSYWVAALAAPDLQQGRARVEAYANLAKSKGLRVAVQFVDEDFNLSQAIVEGRMAPPLEVIRIIDAI